MLPGDICWLEAKCRCKIIDENRKNDTTLFPAKLSKILPPEPPTLTPVSPQPLGRFGQKLNPPFGSNHRPTPPSPVVIEILNLPSPPHLNSSYHSLLPPPPPSTSTPYSKSSSCCPTSIRSPSLSTSLKGKGR